MVQMIINIHEFDILSSVFWLQKNLDFKLKVIGGDLTGLPGISDAIEVWEISISMECQVLKIVHLPNKQLLKIWFSYVQETILDAIEDSITWPVRNIVPIIPGDYRYANFSSPSWAQGHSFQAKPWSCELESEDFAFSDLELKPIGTLEVKLVQAKELTNKDLIGKSDPFAVIFVRPIRDRMKTSKTIVRYKYPIRDSV